jgi:tetratricopeptide (TPR) repeat protein
MMQGRRVVSIMRAEILKIRALPLITAEPRPVGVAGLVVILATAAFAQNGSSLSNPLVRNPLGSGTTPVTVYQNGLVASPNPIDPTSDLIVTGNVGGGRHFRGVVPYNAISDFGGWLGSGTLDDFLRRSTVPQNYYSGGVIPFYPQTGTVTHIVPGTNMVVIPPSTKIRTQYGDTGVSKLSLLERTEADTSLGVETSGLGRARFFPMDTEQMEPYLSRWEEDQAEKEKDRERYQQEYKQFNEQLNELSQDIGKLQRRLDGQSRVKPSIESDSDGTYEQELELLSEPQVPPEPEEPCLPQLPFVQEQQQPEKVDIYEKMLEEYEEAKKSYEEYFAESEGAEEQEDTGKAEPQTDVFERKLKYEQPARITPAQPEPAEPAEKKPASELEVLARTRRVLSERQTFAVYSQDKFNQYMHAAEQYMQQGKFYLAADAYSYASIYKPLDPLAYAGKSHALFAAGEYLSSALYLNRAIEMFNGYVDFKIDITTMIGDMDTIERRIADIKAWIELSSAPELEFLLAYVYMQLDRMDKASEAINAAYGRMPDAPAVGLLKAAIEKRRGQ